MRKILVAIITFTTLSNLNAQSGGWDGSGTNGTTGFKDWGNGVIQLLDYNSTGCAGSAVHETTSTYDATGATDFNQCYQVYFGCPGNDNIGSDSKGDGMAFSFWKSGLAFNINNGLACGGGLGYMGTVGAVDPNTKMITIEFDTWSSQGNFGFDAAYGGGVSGTNDEIAIHRGGDASDGGRLTSANAGNLEDGLEHAVCINYNHTTHILSVSIDGVSKITYDFTGSAYEFSVFFGAGGVNQTWSAGKYGATDQATVSNGASIFANVGGAFNLPTPTVANHTICAGDPAATFDAGAGYVSYLWNTGANTQTITASSAASYSVTVTNTAGCSGSGSGNLTVNPLPVVNVADKAICAGNTTTFDAGNAGATFAWTGPGGFTSTSQTPTVSAAGTYSVTVTINGCSASDNAILTVNALPVVNVADKAICSGNTTTFDAGNAGSTYAWTGPGGFTSTAQNPTVSVAGTYSVTVTTNSCSAGDNAILTVNTAPTVNVADKAICFGNTTTFDAGNAGATFAWTGPAAFTSTSQTPTVSVAGTYFVTVTKNGCSASDNAVLSIAAAITVNVADQTICTGNTTTFDAGNAGATFAWTGPGGFTSTAQNPTVSVAGSYSVTVTKNGCSASDNAVLSIAGAITVNVADKTICAGSTTTFDAGNAGATFAWTGPNAFVSTAQTPTVTAAGTYSVTVTMGSCSASDNAILTLTPLPVVTISNKIICTAASTTFDAGNAGATYAWTGPGGFTSTAQTPTVTTAGTYSVTVTKNACFASGNATLTINAAITPNLISDTIVCVGQSVELNPGTLSSLHYSWTPTLETTQTIYVSTAGTYKVTVSDDNNCKGNDSIVVQFNVPVNTNLNLGSDATICDNDYNKLTLSVNYTPVNKLHWSTLDSNVSSIVITKPGSYWVKVTDANKCSIADTIEITHYCEDIKIDWPNVITTNDDNLNDKFQPKDLNDSNFQNIIANINWISFEVYDRWGILLFSSGSGILPNWDGKYNGSAVPSGTYYFLVKYQNLNGKKYEVPGFMTVLH
jgi:gliding motility-associated-like protein